MSLTTNDLFCVCMHVCEMCDKTLKKCRLYPISARKRHDVIMRARPVDRPIGNCGAREAAKNSCAAWMHACKTKSSYFCKLCVLRFYSLL